MEFGRNVQHIEKIYKLYFEPDRALGGIEKALFKITIAPPMFVGFSLNLANRFET
jgi:hypothetical protein